MRTFGPSEAFADRSAVCRWLEERIAEIEGSAGKGCAADGPAVVPTGWPEVDACLPGGGLRLGAVHEWFTGGDAAADRWTPPLFILIHLVRCAGRLHAAERPPLCESFRGAGEAADAPRPSVPSWTVWVGRRVWPFAHALADASRSFFVDPPDFATRLWAIEAALRTPGLVVVADGSGLTLAATRRLQLSAEAGRSFGLAARPPGDRRLLSAAFTRWSVAPLAGGSLNQRWELSLDRCKGVQPSSTRARRWTVERNHETGLVVVPAAVVDRPVAAARAS